MNMRYLLLMSFMTIGSYMSANNSHIVSEEQVAVNDTVVTTQDYPMGYFEDEQGKKNTLDTLRKKNLADSLDRFDAFDYIMDSRYRTYGDSFSTKWSDHLFIEIGAGLEKMAAPSADHDFRPITILHGSVGKQFDKLNTLRGTLIAGWGYQHYIDRQYLKLGAKIDHLFDWSSYISGYNPTRLLSVSSVVGVGAQYANLFRYKPDYSSLEAHAGVQLKFYTGPYGYFTFEPYVGLGTKGYDLDKTRNWRKGDLFYGAQIGYIYYFNNNLSKEKRSSQLENMTEFDKLFVAKADSAYIANKQFGMVSDETTLRSWSQPWFFEFATGPSIWKSHYIPVKETIGSEVAVAGGKWFSPVIGLRLSAFSRNTTWNKVVTPAKTSPYKTPEYTKNQNILFAGLRLEAMFNPFGFNKKSSYDDKYGAHLLFGGEMGWLKSYKDRYSESVSAYSQSYTFGINAWMKLTEGLQAFVEPRYSYYRYNRIYFAGQDNQLHNGHYGTVLVGLRVSTIPKKFQKWIPEHDYIFEPLTVGGSIGTNFAQTSMSYKGGHGINYNIQLFAQYQFNRVSSARISYEYVSRASSDIMTYADYDATNPKKVKYKARKGLLNNRYKFSLLSFDYGINLSNVLAGYDPTRKIDLEAYFGPTIAMFRGGTSKLDDSEQKLENHYYKYNKIKSQTRIGFNAGLKLKYAINDHVAAYFSPTLYWLGDMPTAGLYMHKFKYLETLNFGVQYNFNIDDIKTLFKK